MSAHSLLFYSLYLWALPVRNVTLPILYQMMENPKLKFSLMITRFHM